MMYYLMFTQVWLFVLVMTSKENVQGGNRAVYQVAFIANSILLAKLVLGGA